MTFPVTEHTVKTARHTTGYLACGAKDASLLIFVGVSLYQSEPESRRPAPQPVGAL